MILDFNPDNIYCLLITSTLKGTHIHLIVLYDPYFLFDLFKPLPNIAFHNNSLF